MSKRPQPFLRPLAVSVSIHQLRLVLPIAAVAIIAAVTVPGLAWVFSPHPAPLHPNPPSQEWTAAPDALPMLARVLPGTLPPPDPRQRKPPCRAGIGEQAINGYCWLQLAVGPPCPAEDGAYEHNGKCFAYVLRAEKAPSTPTSGEPQRANVAGP